jgi:1-acyl-sn-glycerol-3-phosphate acyltransferase
MRPLRAALRLLLIGLLILFFAMLRILGMPLALISRRADARWRHFAFRGWSRSVLAVMGVEIEVRGGPPRPPFFLVANHLGYLDILVLASRADAVFVAKSEVARWPIIGLLCRLVGTVFVDRLSRRGASDAVAELERRLARGEGVVLFPEGTSTAGAEVGPFRSPLLEAAVRAGVEVSWAALSYATPEGETPAHLAVCWWGDMTFADHFVKLLSIPSLRASLVFGSLGLKDRDRKRLAERLQRAVDGSFRPVVEDPNYS